MKAQSAFQFSPVDEIGKDPGVEKHSGLVVAA
jgi:hypothetical protein